MDSVVLQQGRVFLRFDVLGYQFPEIGDQEWDSDWLNVRLHLQCGERTWERVDPALTSFEIQWLADWLDEVAQHAATFGSWRHNRLTTRIFFTEPCLGFEVLNGHPTGAAMTFRCFLAAEFLPPFKDLYPHADLGEGTGEVWLDFSMDEARLRAIAARWREALGRFPVRLGVRSIPPPLG